MSFLPPGDDLVSSVSLYRDRHWSLHLHIGPYIALAYPAWFYTWATYFGIDDYWEAGMIALAAVALIQVLLCLSCHWNVHILAAFSCSRVSTAKEATVAKVVPQENNGASEIVRVRKKAHGEICFVFQKLKYVYDGDKKLFRGVEFPCDQSYGHYLDWKGYESDEEMEKAKKEFGNNM
jgi:cation-transporting ATPase 13A1